MAAEPRTLVCASCLTASCWHSQFRCDDYQSAGLLRATEAQLRKLDREHESYFMPHFLSGEDDTNEPNLEDRVMVEMTTPKPRDLTWLEPRDQEERCRMLDRLDAALAGADQMAGSLGQTTVDYADKINRLRHDIREERADLLAEMDEKS